MRKEYSPTAQRRIERRIMALSALMILLSVFLIGQHTGRFTGALFAQEPNAQGEASVYDFSDLFAEVYREIKDKYVEEVDEQKLFEGAIHGMFMALDPHSQYMDPDSFSQLEKDTEGEFSGIGIQITMRDNVLTVISPIKDSPAAEVGIQPWDRIIEIEGESTAGMDTTEAVRRLTGPEDTKVNITVFREGADPSRLYFTITRKHIKIDSVFSRMLGDGIAHIRLERFSDNTTDDLRKALESAKANKARGLIIDLRYNSGGLLKEAITASDLFLPKDKVIVSTKGRVANQNRVYKSESDIQVDWPMLILINSGTASASEIFAGAMRDHGRALLIGPTGENVKERTFGKGSVQTIEPLEHSLQRDENGNFRPNAIRLTTARYYTPSGQAIDNADDPEQRGLKADLTVPITADHSRRLLEQGLLGQASMIEPGKSDSATSGSAETEEALTDLQLQFAIEEMKRILNGESDRLPAQLHAEAKSADAPAMAAP